jgi:hypothetical protein
MMRLCAESVPDKSDDEHRVQVMSVTFLIYMLKTIFSIFYFAYRTDVCITDYSIIAGIQLSQEAIIGQLGGDWYGIGAQGW